MELGGQKGSQWNAIMGREVEDNVKSIRGNSGTLRNELRSPSVLRSDGGKGQTSKGD